MDELRVVRREESTLILVNELGEEFRFVVDDTAAAEFRQILRRPTSGVTVRPREIQAALRAGKSRLEVAVELDLEEADIERFEEPVRAEQRYMLDLAHGVSVRTNPGRDSDSAEEQRFGEVIAERLISLGNTKSTWRSWRDEEAGWMIGLEFDSREADHDAIWAFDHKKRTLAPLTTDATNLSKVGDIGDRLIPKLRAVDTEQIERPRIENFDPDALLAPTAEVQPLVPGTPAPAEATNSQRDAEPALNADAEYARRRDIEYLAVSTPSDSEPDLNQTADLLDALRRRRGERSAAAQAPEEPLPFDFGADPVSAGADATAASDGVADSQEVSDDTAEIDPEVRPKRSGIAANIWGASGVSRKRGEAPAPAPEAQQADAAQAGSSKPDAQQHLHAVDQADTHVTAAAKADPATAASAQGTSEPDVAEATAEATGENEQAPEPSPPTKPARESRGSKRGRSSIPSWDDILFGTRSDDDPA